MLTCRSKLVGSKLCCLLQYVSKLPQEFTYPTRLRQSGLRTDGRYVWTDAMTLWLIHSFIRSFVHPSLAKGQILAVCVTLLHVAPHALWLSAVKCYDITRIPPGSRFHSIYHTMKQTIPISWISSHRLERLPILSPREIWLVAIVPLYLGHTRLGPPN